MRYKSNVGRFLGGLDLINRLRPISFTWKQDGVQDIGLGAEEVEKVEPLLTFRNAKGEIVDSGGSLTFDKYDANQIVQLAGVDDKDDKFAGLMVGDTKPGGDSPTRIWVGRKDDGTATVALMDGNGRKRLVMEVPESGTAKISFLDANGKVLSQLVPAKTK